MREEMWPTSPLGRAGDEQHRRHAALAVIVGGLQQHRRLAGIHRRVVEIELGHAPFMPDVGLAGRGGAHPRKSAGKRGIRVAD